MKLKFLAGLVALLSMFSVPAFSQVTVEAPQTVTVKAAFVAAPAGASATVTVNCKNLVGNGQQIATAVFGANGGTAGIQFPLTGPTAAVPGGSNCRIDVTNTPWTARVDLDVADISHTGVGGVNSVSWKYPSGWFPVYASTTASLKITYPSVSVETSVVNWDFVDASYRVDAVTNGTVVGSVNVKGVSNVTRTFGLNDFPNADPSSTFNVVVTNTGNTNVSVLSISGVRSGDTAKLVFVGTPKPTTTTTTAAPVTTTTVAPTTTTVAPTTTTTTVVKTVVKCYRKVGKKFVVVKCPRI